jgi:BASS family bile acid:Na+ symporter
MGMTLTPRAIVDPLAHPRFVVRALLLNFVFAPAFAWLLTMLFPLDRGHAAGMLLLGGAAGAPFLPKLVQNARGETSLAIALMALLTVGTILFMPFVLPWMVPGFTAHPWVIARPLLLLIVLPLAIGMLVKGGAPGLASRAAPAFAGMGNASLLLLFVLLIAVNLRALLGVVGSGAILAALLYVIGLFAGAWFLGGPKADERVVLALGTTARNFGAALVPAASSFSDPKVTIMLIVSAIVGLVISFLAAGWVRRRTPLPPGGVGLKADGNSTAMKHDEKHGASFDPPTPPL